MGVGTLLRRLQVVGTNAILISAVAISGVVFVVLMLPEVIRVWTMPDDVSVVEPQVVGGTEA